MIIGIACDLRPVTAAAPGAPDDLYEEFDSIETVRAIAGALAGLGHDAEILGGGRAFLERALADPPDLVWNIAEGRGGRCRESHVPAVCEMLGIPYTHSDPLTLAATLDKSVAKRMVAAAGVRTPAFTVVRPGEDASADEFPAGPLIVKPLDEGSSKGIRGNPLCHGRDEALERARRLIETYGRPAIVESFIAGREITVGLVGDAVLGAMEIVPRGGKNSQFIYSLEVKRDFERQVDYRVPPDVPPEILRAIESTALAAYHALECRDVARVDLRLDDADVPHFIEANPLPGLSPKTGDLTILAGLLGISHSSLIARILDAALRRLNLNPAAV